MTPRRGFTLLEVMLVLLIVGLLTGVVALNFAGKTPQQQVQQEVLRFTQAFQFVAEQAQLQQQEWGLVVAAESYAFVYYSPEGWQLPQQPAILKEYVLPEGIRLQLELEGLPGAEYNLLSQLTWEREPESRWATDQEKKAVPFPQVFILSSGEISPFRVNFVFDVRSQTFQERVGTDFSLPLQRFDGVS